jgi:hypothetical protein
LARKPACIDAPCRYFTKPGKQNTNDLLDAVARRAKELAVKKVLVATCSGRTAMEARKVLDPTIRIIAVTHYTGFEKPNHQELTAASRRQLESRGVVILTCQHAFGGVGRGIRRKLATYQVDEIMAYTLRTFGQGTKVAMELALMAADAGLVRTDEDVICIGGTSEGADTALVLQPANTAGVFDLRVREIIAKPRDF